MRSQPCDQSVELTNIIANPKMRLRTGKADIQPALADIQTRYIRANTFLVS